MADEKPPIRILEIEDLHAATIRDDKDFHTFMDTLVPGWRAMPFAHQRMFAKQWNFAKMYGMARKP